MESAHIIYGLASTCTNNGKEMRGAVLVRCEDVGNGENEHTHHEQCSKNCCSVNLVILFIFFPNSHIEEREQHDANNLQIKKE